MKRIILCSLSAAVALTAGSIARADTHNQASPEVPDPTEGIISPNENSPSNRQVPSAETGSSDDARLVETDSHRDTSGESFRSPTDGVISPNSNAPYNRQIPGADALGDGLRAVETFPNQQ